MAVTDHIVPDNPTNNFATLNPLDKALRNGVLSEGNLKSTDSTSNWSTNYLNIVPKSGVYYVEFYSIETATTSGAGIFVGNKRTWPNVYTDSGYPYDTNTFGIYQSGSIYNNNSTIAYAGSWTVGDVISLIVDYNTRNFWFRVNNSIVSGDDHTGSQSGGVASKLSLSSGLPDGDMFIYIIQRGQSDNTAVSQMYVNTGQDSSFGGNKTSGSANASDANGHGDFYYTPPTGALALCTQNIPKPSIDSAVGNEPEDYFKAVAYAGSIGTNALVDCGFPADLIWIKGRQASFNTAPLLYDTIRGRTSVLQSHNTDAEYDYSSTGSGDMAPRISTSSVSINGFKTPGGLSGTLINNNINNGNCTYVAWFWRAAGIPSGATSATGSAKRINTSGTQDDTSCDAIAASATITPTLMSINQQVGFSIVSYTSNPNSSSGSTDTLPHGLTSAPEMIMIKQLNSANDWMVWHKDITNTNYNLNLNNTGAEFSVSSGGIRTPNASAIDLGGSLAVNSSWSNTAQRYICYAWHSVPGYSAFGSYTGNDSTDGPFVYTGFRPAFIMCKAIEIDTDNPAYYGWTVIDNQRPGYNGADLLPVYANMTKIEGQRAGATTTFSGTNRTIDLLSNGFKIRIGDWGEANKSPKKYIYMAFAEQPINYANAR